MPEEFKRCIHEMREGTCALCKGYPQTIRVGTNAPAYIHENSFYRMCKSRGRMSRGHDVKGDYNNDE